MTVTVAPVPKDTKPVTTTPPTSTSKDAYLWSYRGDFADYTVYCETSRTLSINADLTPTQCMGSSSTSWPDNITKTRPTPTSNPDPTQQPKPNGGWFECNDGGSGPVAAPGCGKGICVSPPHGDCEKLCQGVMSACPNGKKDFSINKMLGFGLSVDLWVRDGTSFGDERDCPQDKATCNSFCKDAYYGPIRKGLDYCGGYAYACDRTGKRSLATLSIMGQCGFGGTGLGPLRHK